MSSDKTETSDKNDSDSNQSPSEFVIGLVTFIVFLVFMTVWMYLGLEGKLG